MCEALSEASQGELNSEKILMSLLGYIDLQKIEYLNVNFCHCVNITNNKNS